MPRTPIPKHLIHDPQEVEKNGKLFDSFADLIPQEVIPIEPIWPLELDEEKVEQFMRENGFGPQRNPSDEEKEKENQQHIEKEQKLVASQIAATLVDKIREKVETDGKVELPFGLVIIKSDQV